jgi:NAD(P)-dependent dehydrogenase (short-subunit alcohol dehydrogenase family)
VVLAGRRAKRLDEVARELAAEGAQVRARPTDVADPDACAALVDFAVAEFGQVDGLVNNAGVGAARAAVKETPEQFRQVIDINLNGVFWMAQACAKVMPPGSSIVNVSSVLGLVAPRFPQASYAASKAGVLGLTRDLAQQWSRRRHIRVNALCPGYFLTEMTEGSADQLRENVERNSPQASAAPRRRPVSSRSSPAVCPIRLRQAAAAGPGTKPERTSGRTKNASSTATAISAAAAIASPAPIAAPLTRQTTGTGESSILLRICPSSSVDNSIRAGSPSSDRSAPEENTVPAPVTTMTRTDGSAASSARARSIDDVACFFPELTIVLQHGGEPWVDTCVKLMVKWPNVHYMSSAIAPKHIPRAIIDYANTRGADRVLFASDYPLLTHERCLREARALPFKDADRFTKFVATNAATLFFAA